MNDTATQQKKDNEVIDLIDDIKAEDNPFNDIFKADTEDIFINDNLFDSFDQNDKKDMVSDDLLQDENLGQNSFLFEKLLTGPARRQKIKPSATLELPANKIFKNTIDKEIEGI